MSMRPNSPILIIFLFLVSGIFGFVSAHETQDGHHGDMRLELIHKYSPHFNQQEHGLDYKKPETQLELIKELHKRDVVRHQMMSHRRQQQQQQEHHHDQGLNSFNISSSSSTRRKDWETRSSMGLPMSSGFDYGFGNYLVKIKVGTPAQKFLLIADTGSDLTWINCRYRCGRRCGTHGGRLKQHKRVFRADLSSTFHTLACSSPMCLFDLSSLFSLNFCPTPFSPCKYDYRYFEGSGAIGIFARETVRASLTNGRRTKLDNVVIGCTETIQGTGGILGGDGILGLGFGKSSFTRQAALRFGGKFSYCLVDHTSNKNVSNYLTFGGGNKSPGLLRKMSYTKLLLGGNLGAYYGVEIKGLSVGGKLLNIPMRVWDLNLGGGAILDSGTSLTYLTMPAYKPVMDELAVAFSKFKIFSRAQGSDDPFEFCFDPKGYNESLVPKFAIHFADGIIFEPPVRSYVIQVSDNSKCLAFVPVTEPGLAIIGNIMQQNHLWEFNLVHKTVGFAASSCT